jgi:predicted RecA/RadA family phage recombinase
MKNYIQPGNVLTLTSSLDLGSGDPVLIGKFFGVCNHDTAAGLPTEVSVVGVYSLPKKTDAVFAAGRLLIGIPQLGTSRTSRQQRSSLGRQPRPPGLVS